MTDPVPVHQFTHDGDKVLLLRCCNSDGTSFGGYQWPEVGETSDRWYWRIRSGAFVSVRVRDRAPVILSANDHTDGETIAVEFGEVVSEFDWKREFGE